MAISISSWFTLKHVALLALAIILVEGVDIYSNSFISPKSEGDFNEKFVENKIVKATSHTVVPNAQEIRETLSTSIQPLENIEKDSNIKVKRSADPILSKTTGIDGLLAYKNVEESIDSNDVEMLAGAAYYIQPSKTLKLANFNSGEAKGAPQARSVQLQEPQQINPTATVMKLATTASPPPFRGRQANPDIQDIITGIVKLLNGNVNVQANTSPGAGRPLRPLSTRINNRGPPRITDVPALPPDFDIPAPPLPPPPLGQMPPPISSTRVPTPYPFDIPPQNTSPIRPYDTKRPGLYRPVTIPPWHRRKPPRRPGNPSIPPYKPLPESISITSEKPMEDILTLDLGAHLAPSNEETSEEIVENTNQTTTTNTTENMNENINSTSNTTDEEISNFEKNKEKSSSKMNKYTTVSTSTLSKIETSSTELNTTVPEISPTTTSTVIETSTSSLSITNDTIERKEQNDTIPNIEPSIQEIMQTLTEELTSNTSTTSQFLSTSTKATEPLSSIQTIEVISTISSSSASSSYPDTASTTNLKLENSTAGFPYHPYRPRPGIVLDDTEYKPGRQPIQTRPSVGAIGDIFDITVSAIQGPSGQSNQPGKPYVIPVEIDNVNGDIITSPTGTEGFVSIDGKRTYLNLFGESTKSASVIKPSAPITNQVTGTGYVIDEKKPNIGSVKPTQRRPIYGRPRPSQPPVRIDTCIVGDDSTCDGSQHEICRTEAGVSACHCRPGHARRKHRDPCRKIVSLVLSLRVDRLYERRVVWASELADKNSDSYQQLSYEAERALESAMSMTPFSDEFLGAKVNSIYRGQRAAGQAGVFINMTLQLDENADTSRSTIKAEIQKHLLGVIQRRSNNVGNSALWVDSPPGSVSNLQDLDECSSPELHDCHSLAKCINVFGGFKCECQEGYRDPWIDNKHRAGRQCEQCSTQHCNNRGECKYQNGQEVCICTGNYYGTQCELDGEVLGVAIGASVAAVIIIGLTLVCLVMWSRRWSREQKAAVGSPVFGYMATASNTVKTPVVGAPPYQLTLEDRLRWAQIADVMAQANHYAPEPVTGPTRPSSALFGYPNLSISGTMQHGSMHGTLPPVPLPRLNLQATMANRAASLHGMRPLDNSSSSEEEDKVDLLGRSFQVPRPKSRSNASIANQSGIYYDVDYEQNEIYKQTGGIPLSTYNMGRQPYYRN